MELLSNEDFYTLCSTNFHVFSEVFLVNLVDSDNFIVEKGNTIHLSTLQVQANLITVVFLLCT